jgi:hypothetical protein
MGKAYSNHISDISVAEIDQKIQRLKDLKQKMVSRNGIEPSTSAM